MEKGVCQRLGTKCWQTPLAVFYLIKVTKKFDLLKQFDLKQILFSVIHELFFLIV